MPRLPLFDGHDGFEPRTHAAERASRHAAHGPAEVAVDPLVAEHASAREIACHIPSFVKFGTSSWSFPGWRGLVYSRTIPAASLARDGLRDYATHPLLGTVGVDRTYYAAITDDELRHYGSLVPSTFGACFKAPAAVTSLTAPTFGDSSGPARLNPDFLSVERLELDLLAPLARAFSSHVHLVILEFPPTPGSLRLDASEFVDRIDHFLARLPREFRYVVEIRESRLLTSAYRDALARHHVGHTYNYWARMPMPSEQSRLVPLTASTPACVRLLMRPGTTYEAQRERFRPFDRLIEPDARMRRDVVTLVRDAAGRGVPLYVLVNNKAEGSAPLTIRALAQDVANALTW